VRTAKDRFDKELGDGAVEDAQRSVEDAVNEIATMTRRLVGDLDKANHHSSSLLSEFRVKDEKSYEYLQAIVAVATFAKPEADWNAYEKCAASVHKLALRKLRGSDVARYVHDALHGALTLAAAAAPGSALTVRSLATADGLQSVASRLSALGSPCVNEMCFVANALCELAKRINRPQPLQKPNEATARLHNNKVITNGFDAASLEVQHSTDAEDIAAVTRDTSSAAARHGLSRIHDEVVFAQDEIVLRGETVMSDHSDSKKTGDCNRLFYATLKQWSVLLVWFVRHRISPRDVAAAAALLARGAQGADL
jgi:hypothetical protein